MSLSASELVDEELDPDDVEVSELELEESEPLEEECATAFRFTGLLVACRFLTAAFPTLHTKVINLRGYYRAMVPIRLGQC